MTERLNALAKINDAQTYLEIGVATGATFRRVQVPYKVAVDPHFGFDAREYSNALTIFHQVTSDIFFSQLAPNYKPFDLIYLDGLHTFEQTFRDFCASLRHSHSRTIWLLDDTHPTSLLAAHPDQMFALRLREKTRFIRDRRWMGDVYKVVFAIHDFFPQFSYATFPEHGQTAVWQETRADFAPTWNSLKKISGMKYRDFLKYRDSHLNFLETAQIPAAIQAAWSRADD
jgi:hypothetical protein